MLTHDHLCRAWTWPYIIKNNTKNLLESSWEDVDNDVDLLLLDVGANAGDFSSAFFESLSTKYKLKSYGFEPYPLITVRQDLKENPNYTLIPKAIGKEKGSLVLHVPTPNGEEVSATCCSSLYSRPVFDSWDDTYIKKFDVEVTTLDEFITQNKITKVDFLKVDVEGWELNAFKGASKSLANGIVATGLFEYGIDFMTETGGNLGDILDFMDSHNYSCFWGTQGRHSRLHR